MGILQDWEKGLEHFIVEVCGACSMISYAIRNAYGHSQREEHGYIFNQPSDKMATNAGEASKALEEHTVSERAAACWWHFDNKVLSEHGLNGPLFHIPPNWQNRSSSSSIVVCPWSSMMTEWGHNRRN